MKSGWKSIRSPILACTFVGILLLVGRLALLGTGAPDARNAFRLPEKVPLPGWEASSDHVADRGLQHYRCWRGADLIEIEMIYIPDLDVLEMPPDCLPLDSRRRLLIRSDGRMDSSGVKFSSPPALEIRNREGTGFHAIWVDAGQSHLSAYVNPTGGSTVTARQFTWNRYAEMRPDRFLRWLLGRGRLQDGRSILAHFSILTDSGGADASARKLEDLWTESAGWWAAALSR
jgi:cyanosortase A-associated protein